MNRKHYLLSLDYVVNLEKEHVKIDCTETDNSIS